MRHRRNPHARRSHGALWSIIYIDLMTQIMAFFVIVWSVEHGARATQTAAIGSGLGIGDRTVRMVDLPGDVLFASGQTQLATDGRTVIDRLFGDAASGALAFDQGGLAQRKLVIHGHTDDVGLKDANFQLGYQRAYAVYQEIRRYSREVPDHVILCTHADNTPAQSGLPALVSRPANERSEMAGGPPAGAAGGAGGNAPRGIDLARAQNRRITIEDLVIEARPTQASNDASNAPR